MVTANYCGDIFLASSGVGYYNPLRSASAAIGAAAGTAGFLGEDGKVFGYDSRDIVMNGVRIASLGFMLSGSNVFGFEEAPRFSEVFAGASLFAAATLNLNDRPKLSGVFFSATTVSWGAQVVETAVTHGAPDWYMMGALICFTVSNAATFFMKRRQKQPQLRT